MPIYSLLSGDAVSIWPVPVSMTKNLQRCNGMGLTETQHPSSKACRWLVCSVIEDKRLKKSSPFIKNPYFCYNR